MKVFVAGGGGALGRRVAALLVAAGHRVTATARNAPAAIQLTAAGAEPVEVDLFDRRALRQAVAGHEAVLRLTTKIPTLSRMRSGRAWSKTGRLRTSGAALLVQACRDQGVGIYVHESVAFVYADGGDAWIDEDAPIDVNGAVPLRDAARGETNAHVFTREGGRGIVLRFAGFYAPDSAQTLTMAAMARRRRMALIGRGDNYFSSIHTDDAAAAVVASLDAPAGVYNVGDDNPLRFREYMAAMTDAVGAPPLRRIPRFTGPLVMGATWNYLRRSQRISARRLKQTVGWRPRVTDAREGWRAIGVEWSRSASA